MNVNVQPVLIKENAIVSREKIVKPHSKDSRVLPLKILGSSIYKKVAYKNNIFLAKLFLLVPFIFIFIFTGTAQAIDVSSCGTLGTDGGYYTIVSNISSSGTCITMGADNITLDGQGHTINYSQSSSGFGIDNQHAHSGITIKDVRINEATNQIGADGINEDSTLITNKVAKNFVILNTTITLNNPDGGTFGIYFKNTSSGKISNTSILNGNTYGIYFENVSNVVVSDNVIIGSGRAIYLPGSPSVNNTFSNNTLTMSGYPSYGVRAESGSNMFSNNTITVSGGHAYGIYISAQSNSIINNSITVSGSYGYGIYITSGQTSVQYNNITASYTGISIFSNNNSLLNNNVTTTNDNSQPILIWSYINNNVTGGSFMAQGTGSYDYSLYSDSSNYFTNTNFSVSAQRKIYFANSQSFFNYSDTGGVFLLTNLSLGDNNLKRSLLNWTSSNISWRENASNNLTVYYSIYGLPSNAYYNVSNSIASQTVSSESKGVISFNFSFPANVENSMTITSVPSPSGNNTTPPTISIIAPSNGSTVSGIINVTDLVSDSVGITRVELYLNGALIGTKTSSPFTFVWDTTQVANNVYTFQSKAYDAANNSGTSQLVAVAVNNKDNIPPSVSITSPLDGANVPRKLTVTINASASDKVGVTKVEFYVNGALQCTDTTQSYTCSWNVPARPGVTHLLQAKAYDAANNVGSSAIVKVTSI